jgi:phosphate transport system substrate-binding protein
MISKISAAILVMLGLTGYAGSGRSITIKGSDTMVILGQRWAEEYMKRHPGLTLQVTGGGSGTGISALINGTTDICNSSRPMKDAEKAKLKEKFGSPGIEIRCAVDGLSMYVNKANRVKELSLQQIKEIYTGKITNWKDVGGTDGKIIMYSRENNSGTYAYFKEEVLGNEDFDAHCQNMPGTASVVNAVLNDKAGIGYGGVAYGKGIKELKVRKDASSPAYEPSLANIKSGKYPISRYLYMYVVRRPEGDIKSYVDWILAKEGQAVVESVGFVPLKRK